MGKRLEQASLTKEEIQMKPMKRHSTPFVIRETQNKPSTRHTTYIIKLLPERLYQVVLPSAE